MKLAIIRHVGSPDRWLVGQISESDEALLEGEPDPTEPHVYEPDEDLPTVSTGPLCGVCEHPEGHQLHQLEAAPPRFEEDEDAEPAREKIRLEAPGVMVLLVGFGEHPTIAGQQGAVVQPVVQILPYTRETVYLDGVIGHAVEPLEAEDGQAPTYVVELYNLARGAAAAVAAPSRRRRIVN